MNGLFRDNSKSRFRIQDEDISESSIPPPPTSTLLSKKKCEKTTQEQDPVQLPPEEAYLYTFPHQSKVVLVKKKPRDDTAPLSPTVANDDITVTSNHEDMTDTTSVSICSDSILPRSNINVDPDTSNSSIDENDESGDKSMDLDSDNEIDDIQLPLNISTTVPHNTEHEEKASEEKKPDSPPPQPMIQLEAGLLLSKELEARCRQTDYELQKELEFNEFIRWSDDHYNKISSTVNHGLKDLKVELRRIAKTQSILLEEDIKSVLDNLGNHEQKCRERAYRVKKLATEVFESPRTLMVKTRDVIMNEWIHDLYERDPNRSTAPQSPTASQETAANSSNTDTQTVNANETNRTETNKAWQEEMFRLTLLYHAQLKAKCEIDCMNVLVRQRQDTMEYWCGDYEEKKRISRTLERSAELAKFLTQLIENKIYVLEKQMDVTVSAMASNGTTREDISLSRVTLPQTFGETLFEQVRIIVAVTHIMITYSMN